MFGRWLNVQFRRVWTWWLTAGIVLVGGYFVLPTGLPRTVAYNLIGLASVVGILAGVRMHRPQRPRLWYWFAAGQIVWVLGDLVWEYYLHVLHQELYPSWADAFYLSAYPLIVLGMLAMLRGHGRRDAAALVDAAIVATGMGLVFWVAVVHPIAADASALGLERAISVAYPVGDALLLAMLARLFSGGGARTASSRLLGVAVLLLLAADVGYSVVTLYWDYESGFLDAGWLLSYVVWAAAALHPSMRDVGTRATGTGQIRMTRSRLTLLAASSLLAPGLLFVPGVGGNNLDRIAIGGSAVLLFLLVLVRMAGFTRQVQQQAGQLADLVMRDDLTGLASRRRFEQGIKEALAAGRPQVILLDLDGFKAVNDDLGHSVGDRLLVVLGRRLANVVRADSLVARMGGDEFAVLLPDADAADAAIVVDRLTGALREAIKAGPHELLVAASIGSADGSGTDDAYEVLRRADVAMYAAKQRGERHRRYAADLDEQASELARIGAELRTALDAGQFRLVYQPIVKLPHGRIVAVETLVRWAHPERGLVGPGDFVEVAEQNGLIVELGAWILRTACRQAAEWRAEYGADAPGRISVNVSARQLAQPGFAAVVAAALADGGLPAAALAVEVTETAVFEGGPALVALHEIRALGVQVALDDFGTGHSSLGLLQTVPATILKVDKSFVDNITMAGRHAVIATSLIDISRGLGLVAVAEGVETAEQAAELYRIGYRYAQGYHFGRPVPEPEFRAARRDDSVAAGHDGSVAARLDGSVAAG